jgi:hypothetical protein
LQGGGQLPHGRSGNKPGASRPSGGRWLRSSIRSPIRSSIRAGAGGEGEGAEGAGRTDFSGFASTGRSATAPDVAEADAAKAGASNTAAAAQSNEASARALRRIGDMADPESECDAGTRRRPRRAVIVLPQRGGRRARAAAGIRLDLAKESRQALSDAR